MPTYEITSPDGKTYDVTAPEGASQDQVLSYAKAHFAAQPQQQDTAQPSTLDRIIASPVGRFAQENVVAPALGLGTMLSHAVTNDPRVDTMQNAETGGYDAALARNRNTPGYAEARAQVDQSNLPSGAASGAFLPSVQSSIAGLPGLMTGNLDMSNAMADAASQHQEQYRKDNPTLATAQGLVGGLAAAPEGGLPRVEAPKIPSVDEIKKASNNAYAAARSSGLEISADPFRKMVSNLKSELMDEGFDPVMSPKAARAIQRLDELASNPDAATIPLSQLNIERKVAGKAVAGEDAHMAHTIQHHIDNLVENLTPDQVANGDAAGGQILKEARTSWRTAKKSETIADAFERAQNQAGSYTDSGFGNALRTQFKRIADNKRVFSQFSPDEQKTILDVVRGGRVENAFRRLGKLAPRGVVSLMADMGLGAVSGGGAAPFMVAGEAGKAASTALKVKNANKAFDLVRAGGDASALTPKIIGGPQPIRPTLPLGLIGSGYEQQQYQPWGLSPQY